MRDIKILVISDDARLNSALASQIEAQVFQWKPGVIVFDPHGEQKFQHMSTDDAAIKQMAGECNVEITTLCTSQREYGYIKAPLEIIDEKAATAMAKQGHTTIQPTEPKTDGDHHH